MRRVTALPFAFAFALALALALASTGCNREAGKARDRFLEALKRDDFTAAYAQLHPEGKQAVPSEAALRAQVEASGVRITEWSSRCSSGTSDAERLGMNFSSTARGTVKADGPFEIGAPTEWRRGRCNGPLIMQLKKDGDAWKVVSVGYR